MACCRARRPWTHPGCTIRRPQPSLESSQALLPERAPWLDDFLAELLAFPGGRHDDQVDSVSQALAWAGERWQGPYMIKLTGLY